MRRAGRVVAETDGGEVRVGEISGDITRARQLLGIGRRETIAEAKALHRRALELDPNFAAATAQLARVAVLQGNEAEGRRYLAEYARRPLNMVLLAVVPVVFVTLSAGAVADFADVLGGLTDLGVIEAATAGWAASLLAGISGFFHVTGSRAADRRLAAAGVTSWLVGQTVLNVGGVVGLLPITGLPLPFISDGGSALVVVLAAAGILTSFARCEPLEPRPVAAAQARAGSASACCVIAHSAASSSLTICA